MDDIRIIVAGARGKMGSEAVRLIERTEHFKLVGVVDRTFDGKLFNDVSDYNGEPVRVYTDPEACLENCPADVWIDLTVPKAGFLHAKTALAHGVRPVVGTTGFTDAELEELKAVSAQKGIGCIIAPNFAIGAVLMMKFAQMAAKYFPDVEIIELHHDRKKDAPSGTSVKTAQMISEARRKKHRGIRMKKKHYKVQEARILKACISTASACPALSPTRKCCSAGTASCLRSAMTRWIAPLSCQG